MHSHALVVSKYNELVGITFRFSKFSSDLSAYITQYFRVRVKKLSHIPRTVQYDILHGVCAEQK